MAGPLVSSYPVLIAEIAFATDPGAAPTWVDVSDYLKRFHIKRGRGIELEQNQAGTMSLRLDTSDRRFEPNYAGVLKNHVPNPSLSDLTGWTLVDNGTPSCTANIVATPVLSEPNSLDLYNEREGQDDYVVITVTGLLPGTEYTISAHVDATLFEAPAFFDRALTAYDAADFGTFQSATLTDPTDGFVRKSVTLTTTFSAGSHSIIVQLYSPQGEVYWDAVQLEASAVATAYVDGTKDNCRWAGTPHNSATYLGGPYYPNVVPFRRVRLRARESWGGPIYDLYRGYVERWGPPERKGPKRAYVELDCVDAFALLAQAPVASTYGQDLSSAHIAAYLDTAGWAAADRNILAGQSSIQARTLEEGECLAELQKVAETELGNLFVSPDGKVTFQGRHYRLLNHNVSVATFEDDVVRADNKLPYRSAGFALEGNALKNRIVVNRVGGSEQVFEDAASIARYSKRELPREVLHASDTEAGDYGRYLLQRYKEPDYRASEVVLRPRMDDDLWSQVLGRELGERITLKQHPPPDGSTMIQKDVHIDSIEHEGDRTNWETRWLTTPADPYVYWLLDSSTYSVLDSTTRLAF